MISSELSRKLTEGLKKLRAITEPTTDLDSITYTNTVETEREVTEHPGQMKLEFDPCEERGYYEERERECFIHAEDICYGTYKNQTEEYNWNTENLSDDEYETWLANNLCSDPWLPTTVAASMSAENAISPDNYKQFLQDIAQEAKEWTDRPSDRKKIGQAIEYVLETAKSAPRVDNKLANRLKHDEMMRIVSKLILHVNK